MSLCVNSEFKDDRHDFTRYQTAPHLRVYECRRCERIEVHQLVQPADIGGEVWETVAVGVKKPCR